jgi:hypothetical protein
VSAGLEDDPISERVMWMEWDGGEAPRGGEHTR